MSYLYKSLIYLFLFAAFAGCKKPYNPPAISSPGSYLVVEGVINAGSDSTTFQLSRTVNLSSGVTINPESGATVTVESSGNSSFPLTETSSGTYKTPGLNLDNTLQYRISIKTADNRQYLSDFVPVKNAPPVDSIGFSVQANNLQLYVNTHDPNNNTRYYRFDYSETWQFHAKYLSSFITNGSAIVPRTVSQLIWYCFGSDNSSTIVLASSAKLSQDVIYQNPLTSITSTSEKIETKYSILVKEYALTSDAFTFWTNLKKNTEQLGSIFDAEPTNINGNIHNVNNAAEPVIGYISAGTVQSKRIFIANSQLPNAWIPTYPYNCEQDTNYFFNPKTHEADVQNNLVPSGSPNIPTNAFYLPGSPNPAGYLASDIDCTDCTIRGTTVQPPFWK